MGNQIKIDFNNNSTENIKISETCNESDSARIINFIDYVKQSQLDKSKQEEQIIIKRIIDLTRFLPDLK